MTSSLPFFKIVALGLVLTLAWSLIHPHVSIPAINSQTHSHTTLAMAAILPKQWSILVDRTPIIVIFNRPVIEPRDASELPKPPAHHLHVRCNAEQPVAGDWHWANSSVARFDPRDNWPYDLECTVDIDAALTTYDGIALSKEPVLQQYTSPKLVMVINSVISLESTRRSNGRWEAFGLGRWLPDLKVDNNYPEVPPDGEMRVVFTGPATLDAVGANLRAVRLSDGVPLRFKISTCNNSLHYGSRRDGDIKTKWSHSFCIRFIDEIQAGELHALVLPPGVQLHPGAGPTSEHSLHFYGLLPFFLSNDANTRYHAHVYRVRHGILDATSHEHTIDLARTLQDAISYTPSLPFTVTIIDRATIQVEAIFEPGQTYVMAVNPTMTVPILDGWGQPLQPHNFTFKMDHSFPAYTSMLGRRQIYLPPSDVSQIHIISHAKLNEFCKQNQVVAAGYPVTLDNIVTILNCTNSKDISALEEVPLIQVTLPQDDRPKATPIDTYPLWKASGVFALARPSRFGNECKPKTSVSLIQESDISATILAWGRQHTLAWITNATSDNNVVSTTVHFYGSLTHLDDDNNEAAIVYLGNNKTDDGGIVHLPVHAKVHAIALETGRDRLFVHQLIPFHMRAWQVPPKCHIFTDRRLYAKGETIHVKGYFKHARKSQQMWTHELSVQWLPGHSAPTKYNISLDPTFNSFHTRIVVPPNAQPREYPLLLTSTLHVASGALVHPSYHIVTDVIVAKTAGCSATISAIDATFIQHGGNASSEITLKIATTCQPGVPLAFQSVYLTVSWIGNFECIDHCMDYLRSKIPDKQHDLVTDENGEGTMTIALDIDEWLHGDEITIVATFRDPTTKEFFKTPPLKRYILNGEYQFKMSLAHYAQIRDRGDKTIPGAPQGVFARLYHVPTMTVVEGATVSLMLVPAKDNPTWSNSRHLCSFVTRADMTAPPCHFSVNDTLSYNVMALAMDESYSSVTASIPIVYDHEYWEEHPYTFRNRALTLYPLRRHYFVDDQPSIEYWNPFVTSIVLVYWGCDHFQDVIHTTASYGVQSILLPAIPRVCQESGLFVALGVHGQREGFDIPRGVPLASNNSGTPKGLTGTVKIAIRKRTGIQASIDVASNSVASLRVTDKVGQPLTGEAEACIYIVDKRVNQPQDNGDAFRTFNIDSPGVHAETSRSAFIDNYHTVANVTIGRAQKDPWSPPPTWQLGSISPHPLYPREEHSWFCCDHHWYIPTGDHVCPDPHRAMTPLFVGNTILRDGHASVTLDLPDDLTAYTIRAVVVTKGAEQLATAESECGSL
ncbi:hypothetical protein SAMD00019534_009050 [Acytostelium subglobosum LB1]|uniref:hypothetical protein n=1 Tax=Acytostelium subglobosum LB1 TaxID=1410327 RepID=UPI00064499ED|nr:hypothetical protein SAMD00019534_009050 [Acytostelium subglobosum LB1]GAM17730.1 hypothetical protein SAMD00019534_009050 [Acytostelium subglobosum LB1]|eukprot:XP_012758326.1 hypothetical protein SAMD00019534_009050 [Acytostelium subglobosum LB1]